MSPSPTVRQLEYFITTVQFESVTRAAAALLVSQSALSMALSELEKNLGVQLLIRHSRGVSLTPVGEHILGESRRLVAAIEDLKTSALGFQNVLAGSLNIGCFRSISPILLPRVISTFAKNHPDVTINLVEGGFKELVEQLHAGLIEIAVLYDYESRSAEGSADLIRHRIGSAAPHIELRADHPLANREGLALADLAEEPLILLTQVRGESYFRSLFEAAGIEPNIRYQTTNLELVRALVARGLGYTVLIQRAPISLSSEGLPIVTQELTDTFDPIAITAITLGTSPPTARTRAFIAISRELWQGDAMRLDP
ncbi:LysR substrate-binding domain-containing protein [Dactylosporangium sp. CA-233914]|uniref:LysR substrate-binding domain-containing protein n=1 Tax=Dactylosporangium sp. CA-233914 TaxID=3239934 RepID=UPI003D8D4586